MKKYSAEELMDKLQMEFAKPKEVRLSGGKLAKKYGVSRARISQIKRKIEEAGIAAKKVLNMVKNDEVFTPPEKEEIVETHKSWEKEFAELKRTTMMEISKAAFVVAKRAMKRLGEHLLPNAKIPPYQAQQVRFVLSWVIPPADIQTLGQAEELPDQVREFLLAGREAFGFEDEEPQDQEKKAG